MSKKDLKLADKEEGSLQLSETGLSGMLLSRNVGQHLVVPVSDCDLDAAHSKTL